MHIFPNHDHQVFRNCLLSKGLGIALVAAQRAQIPVRLLDSSQAALDKGLKFAGSRNTQEQGYVW